MSTTTRGRAVTIPPNSTNGRLYVCYGQLRLFESLARHPQRGVEPLFRRERSKDELVRVHFGRCGFHGESTNPIHELSPAKLWPDWIT